MPSATPTPLRRNSAAPHGPGSRDREPFHHWPLARYIEPGGPPREIVALPGAQGSTLLVDRIAGGFGENLLLAHLAADEPAGNARLVCRMYLADSNRGCRRLTPQDLAIPPLSQPAEEDLPPDVDLRDRAGNLYRIRTTDSPSRSLRWTRRRPGDREPFETISLRAAVAALEAYGPACQLTRRAIAASAGASTYALRQELQALSQSPYVLNRALREAVQHAVEHQGSSMSRIAERCGRVKRCRRGGVAGETTWLARRIGQRPGSTTGCCTPWVHTDVLALIAREGLGIAPSEVETS